MKELLLQYAKYNVWANKRMLDVVLKLDASLLDREIVSSFPSIKATIYHMWSADYIWLQRLRLVEQPIWIESKFEGSFEEACAEWLKVGDELVKFVEKQFDDKAFEHVLMYYNLQKQPCKVPVFAVFNHVFNHSSQHRGQLITMLRQVGQTKIPSMDLIIYLNK